MSDISATLQIADIIRTPASLGNYLAPMLWGPGSTYQLDPWLAYAQRKILDAIFDRDHESFVMLNCPPQIGKSSFSGEFLLFWVLGMFPETRIIFITYSDDFSAVRGARVRDMVRSWGMELFGIQVDPENSAKSEWKLLGHRGGMLAVGIEGALNGKPGDLVVIDDVIKDAGQAGSAADKRRHWDIYEGTIHARLQPGGTMLGTMTRWVEDDISGRVQARMHEPGYDGDPWQVISIPAIAEPDEDETDPGPDWHDELGRVEGEPLQCRFTRPGEAWENNHFYKKRRTIDPFTFSCTPAETPIVMADRSEKPINKIQAGDEILGFVQGSSPGGRVQLQPGVVEHVMSQPGRVDTLVMESGALVRCTPDHRWFTGRSGNEIAYRTAAGTPSSFRRKVYAEAQIGSVLRRFDPWLPPLTTDRQRDLDYIAGIIDGEGHIALSALTIAQSDRQNPAVCEAIDACLSRLGWSYNRRRYPGRRVNYWIIRNPRATFTELIRRTFCGKRHQMAEALGQRGCMPTISRDRVVDIIEGDIEDVYALQTTTGNYVAWGFASSNCVYQQQPTVRKGGMFPRDNWRWYRVGEEPDLDYVVRVWDLAATEGGGDFTVGLKMGKAASGHRYIPDGDYVHLDVQRFRKNAADVQAVVVAIAQADGYGVPIKIERERSGSGSAILDFYTNALPFCRVTPAKADGRKENRAVPYSAMQNLRRVWLPTYSPLDDTVDDRDRERNAPDWVRILVAEHRAFMGDGRTGRHDDTVDCGAYAVLEMLDIGPTLVYEPAAIEDWSRVEELAFAASTPRW